MGCRFFSGLVIFFLSLCVSVLAEEEKQAQPTAKSIISIIKIENRRAKEIEEVLSGLFSQVKMKIDYPINALVLQGTEADISDIKYRIKELDQVIQQIDIKATFNEVSDFVSSNIGLDVIEKALNFQNLTPTIIKSITTDNFLKVLDIQGKVRFLSENAKTKNLGRPRIIIENGKKGQIESVDKVPFKLTQSSVVGGQVATSTSVQFEEVGIKLNITPYAYKDIIGLEITGEVSAVTGTTQEGFPTISKRLVSSYLRLKPKYTAVFAGLLRTEERKVISGIWLLKDIPFIGLLFSSERTEIYYGEIIITITADFVTEESFTPPE